MVLCTQMANFQFFILLLFGDWVAGLRGSEQCGIPISGEKILGGVDSGGYRYPWFALLLLKRNSYTPVPVCAGSLITRVHVLTAAHCFTINASTPDKDLYTIALGVYDICDEKEATRQIFNADDVVRHEMYQRKRKFYDIALIKLDRQADYTVVCLPISGVPDASEPALLIGFGVTDENSGSVPCRMMEVNVTKFSKMDCSYTKLPLEDRKEPSVICAGALSGGVDSCSGDSGGPLQTVTSDGRYVIAGIVSYGYGCGVPEVPGIYTNVGSYLQWIRDKITLLGSQQSLPTKNKEINPNLSIRRRTVISEKSHLEVIFPDEQIFTNSSQSTNKNSKTNFQLKGTTEPEPRRLNTKVNISKKESQKDLSQNSKVTFPVN